MKYTIIITIMLISILLLPMSASYADCIIINDTQNQVLTVTMDIPLNEDMAKDMLVAGHSWERTRINIKNNADEPLNNVCVQVEVPEYVDISIPTQPIDIEQTDQAIKATIGNLEPNGLVTIILDVKPPESIEFKKDVVFTITIIHDTVKQISTHQIKIIPPPSWVTYLTILVSLLLFIGIIASLKRFGILEMFSTVDLITIALIAALIAVVFRYFSKLVNLGWFDGLVIAIPTVALMIVALQLVRKPGTATLLFTVVLLISMVIWGSHIMWLGFYLLEGLTVDLLVLLFKMDYADRRLTAVIYGVARSTTATLVFYLLFAPVEWKIYYANWYILLQLGIACSGGLIGGFLGYETALKMSGARL